MRFGETRDPAPTTMEELAPGGLLARLSRMDVVARRAVRGARSGERRSRKRGGGLEFSEHRDYEPGDDLRFVDWNVFARLDRLVTKVFIEEEDLTVALLLGCFGLDGLGQPQQVLVCSADVVCLGVVALRAGHRLRVHGLGGSCPPDLAGLRGGSRSLPLSHWLLDARARWNIRSCGIGLAGGRQGRAGHAVCRRRGADAVRRGPPVVDASLRRACGRGRCGTRRCRGGDGESRVAAGLPIPVGRPVPTGIRSAPRGGRLVADSLDPELVLFELLRRRFAAMSFLSPIAGLLLAAAVLPPLLLLWFLKLRALGRPSPARLWWSIEDMRAKHPFSVCVGDGFWCCKSWSWC